MTFQINKNEIKKNLLNDFTDLLNIVWDANECVNDLNIFWDIYENYFPPYSEFFGNIGIQLNKYFKKIYKNEYSKTTLIDIKDTNHLYLCLEIKKINNRLINNLNYNIQFCKNADLLKTLEDFYRYLKKLDVEITSAINSNLA